MINKEILAEYLKFNKITQDEIERADLVVYQYNSVYRIWKDQIGTAPLRD